MAAGAKGRVEVAMPYWWAVRESGKELRTKYVVPDVRSRRTVAKSTDVSASPAEGK